MAQGESGVEARDEERKDVGLPTPVQETVEGAGDGSSSKSAFSAPKPSSLAASLAVLVIGTLFRTGWTNVLLVLLCSTLLLLNPWVRTFLELRSISDPSSTKTSNLSAYDPARFLLSLYPTEVAGEDAKGEEKQADSGPAATKPHSKTAPLEQSESYAALRRMPAHLRSPIADLEELMIRDYISTWYDYHSFGDQSLPNQARYSIDHAVGSVYAAMEDVRNVDVTSELILTASSVLLTTLRTRRLYPGRKPIFTSNTSRIAALRDALDRMFTRHLKKQDAQCDLLKILMREILCKQIWNAIEGIGNPDFINSKIVEWGESQRETEEQSTWSEEPAPYQHRGSTARSVNTSVQHGASSAGGAENATESVPSSPMIPRALASPSMDGHTFTTKPPLSPSNLTPPKPSAASSEPLTSQPRAMTMPSPSPLGKSPVAVSVPPSPRLHAPPLPRRPLSVGRNNNNIGSSRSPSNENNTGSPQPPALPLRKNTTNRETLTNHEDRAVPDLMSNVPLEANKGMVLPDSLQNSLKLSTSSTAQTSDNVEGYRLSTDSNHSRSLSEHDQNHDYEGDRTSYDRQYAKNSRQGNSSTDSSYYAARSKPSSRPASSASGGIPPAPDLAEVLSGGTSAGLSALRDAFEAFLHRGGAASRSLFFSPPSAATVSSGEGETLLKLHVGLATIARLVPTEHSNEGEVYRQDAYSIILKALHSLNQADDSIAGRPVREACLVAAQRLDVVDDGRVREVTRPVELALWTRLHGLYEHFWKETCTRPAGGRPTVSSPTFNSSGRSSFSASRPSEERSRPSMDQLHYQPRKKGSTANAQSSVVPAGSQDSHVPPFMARPQSTPPKGPAAGTDRTVSSERANSRQEEAQQPLSMTQAPPNAPSYKDDIVTRPVARRGEIQPSSEDEEDTKEEATASLSSSQSAMYAGNTVPSIDIAVTDVSPNADRPAMTVDIRTYEAMIAVEGLVSGGGGFVLLRQWKDFQQLDEQLNKLSNLPDLPVRLPTIKGQTSLTLTREIEHYLAQILSSSAHVGTEAVQYFIDKTRAGEPSSNKSSLLMDSLRSSSKGGLDLGKSLANGVGGLGKNAISTLQMMPGSVVNLRTATKNSTLDPPANSPERAASRPLPEERRAVAREREVPLPREISRVPVRAASPLPQPQPPPPPPPSSTAPARPQEGSSINNSNNNNNRSSNNNDNNNNAASYASELSPQDLDNLLSCAFAIADEAFNLSGGWTLRRGLLRVLEQVVRTQYWSSIMGMFHNLSHSLNEEQIGTWLDQLKDKFWPDEKKGKSTVPLYTSSSNNGGNTNGSTIAEGKADGVGPHDAAHLVEAVEETKERSVEEKQACHLKAKSIVVAQTPSGSAFFLGPGGKQSCEKALNLLHEEICNPETSLDLVLTLVLKLCDIVAR
ncbi:hypothetical protein CBS101457_003296 [Exobasidium rhododendri]|nr:hypothetical protein CBS101457_003296 [Exobasidium rhododendri]